jgi:alpha-glucosidase (family GH31 glycosyl hydrolase)
MVTMWNSDIAATTPDTDLYGSHPFYLAVMPGGAAHGVYLLSSNGMDVAVGPEGVSYRCAAALLCLASWGPGRLRRHVPGRAGMMGAGSWGHARPGALPRRPTAGPRPPPLSRCRRVLGGVLDLYVFLGPGPEQVLQQYHAVIGLPAMVPHWALGFHQCKWGYNSLGALQEVVAGYQQAAVPLEVIWSDIDYMDRFRWALGGLLGGGRVSGVEVGG